MADTNLGVRLTAKDDGSVVVERFAKSLKSVSLSAKQMQADLSATRGSVTSLTSLLKSGLGGAVAGVGVGSVVALGRSFAAAAAEAQGYETRLRVILGSQAEANRLFAEMSKYAARTPFELRAVMESATQLAGVLQGGVDEVGQWMPLIGDLAAMSGLTIQEATGQVVRMLSAGAASADLFRERGVLAMLGFQAGVTYSAEETRKRLLAAWDDVNSKFRGATDEMSRDWAGKVSNIGDAWFNLKKQIGDAVIRNPESIRFLESLAGWLNTAADAAARLTQNQSRATLAMLQGELRNVNRQLDAGVLLNVSGRGELLRTRRQDLERMIADERALLATLSGAGVGPGKPRPPTAPPPPPGTGKAPKYSDLSLAGKFEEDLGSEAAFSTFQRAEGQGEIAALTAVRGSGAAAVRAEFEAFEAAARSAAERGQQERQRLADGNAELAEAAIGKEREAFAAWEEAQKARAAAEEEARQRRVDGVAEVNARVLELEKQHHESQMGLIRERARAEGEAIRARNAAVVAGVALTGQVASQTSALFRQLYEDSGGQAEKYFKYYKAAAQAETIIATAQGIMNIWAGPLGKYPPAAAAFSALVAALGATQVSLIQKQQPAKAFALGGVVTGPTNALIGEAGPEAVIPLDRLPRLVERVTHNQGAQVVQVTVNAPVNAPLDPTVAAALMGTIRSEAYRAVRTALSDDPRARRAVRRAV